MNTNLYNIHKVLLITDEQSLQKENITIESCTKDFDKNIEKITQLKDKIEKEIKEIDTLYEKIDSEVTKSYLAKHEKLTKEENDLREKLQNEVTKVKEKLEIFLSESKNKIKISERINKGIKIIEKENQEQKNMIKILSYITKINKTQKEMKNLFQELMRNIKITFNEENSTIKFDEYYFNGIPSPKDIEFKDITSNSINVNWKIDDYNILNVDKKQIKYKVEMRKENKKFNKIYEGNDNNYKVDNLKMNTNYEFRICSLYNDIIGVWTDIQKIKTNEFECDSKLLIESKKGKEFLQKILEWSGFKKMKLLYRSSKDGALSKNFHEKCDNQGPTVILCKHEKGYLFGGFASYSWTCQGGYKSAPNSFLFTLTNIHGTEPIKFPLKNNSDTYSLYDDSSYGAIFGAGHDLYIRNDFINDNTYCSFPCTYQDNSGKGNSIFTGDLNNNNGNFKVNEIEAFSLLN